MRNVVIAGLIVGTLVLLFTLVTLLGAVQDSEVRANALRPRDPIGTTTRAAADVAEVLASHPTVAPDRVEDPAASAAAHVRRTRPWSPASVALSPPVAGEEGDVRVVRLETYDPATPGPPPSPFASPKMHLVDEDTRAGLDR